jgi:putative transposase
LKIIFFHTATPDRNPTEYCWKMTRENLTSIKSLKNIEALKEEMNEFWEKHTFKHKMSHYLKWGLIVGVGSRQCREFAVNSKLIFCIQ